MKKLISLVAGLAAATLLCVASVSPSCAATTAFVSGGGSDANSCTLSAPCRNIAVALGAAGIGGTVSCLDAGPYTLAYSSNVSYKLDCRGVVYPPAGGFAVQPSASVVMFRDVIFDGATGGSGAAQITGGRVVFENCTFQNFAASPGQAVLFAPTVAGAHLTITDSVFANNGISGSGGGIVIQPSGGVTTGVVIERTQVTGNSYGIYADSTSGTALVDIRYSTISNNTADGIFAVGSIFAASIVVEHSASVRNGGNGINAQGGSAYVSLNDSTVAWNATGLNTGLGGTILSYKNNVIGGNLHSGVTPVGVSQQ